MRKKRSSRKQSPSWKAKRFPPFQPWSHSPPPWHTKEEWEQFSSWGPPHGAMFFQDRMSRRRKLSRRFAGMLVFLVLPLIAVGIVIGIYIAGAWQIGSSRDILGFAVCVLPLLVPILALIVGARGLRRVVNPLADVMAAADALAEGHFDVRVPVEGDQEFRRLARAFNDMAEGLEAAERQRRSLTADVAHELRTPLHILRGNLEGALDGVYEATPDYLDNLLEETRLLERLVEDLQTLSLAESGALSLDISDLSVNELLKDVRTSFLTQAEEGDLSLILELPADDELRVRGDWQRLDQVISNLVANALRHTGPGGKIRLIAQETGEGVEIQVQDTGVGIAEEDLPYVFDRFWKGDKSRSRAGGGSGLGLAIASQLTRAHGGEISVESVQGEGTVFTVRLPGIER